MKKHLGCNRSWDQNMVHAFLILIKTPFFLTDIRKLIEYLKVEAALNSGIVHPLDPLKKEAVRLIRRLIYGKDFNDGKYVKSMHDEIEFLTHFGSYPQLTDVFYYAKYLPSYKRAVKGAEE